MAEEQGMEISNYYMIGDYPSGDIKGSNEMGWTSILVETGNYEVEEGKTNDHDNPASYVVPGFSEAIDLILDKEGIL